MRRRVLGLLLGIGLLAVLPGSVAAVTVGTLDQSQSIDSWGGVAFGPSTKISQTFAAGTSGFLMSVSIASGAYSAGSGVSNVETVEIYAVDHNLPSGSPLASETITVVDGWNDVVFDAPASVLKYGYYAIVVTPAAEFIPHGSCLDVYGYGRMLVFDTVWKTLPTYASDHGASPQDYCGVDLAFETYVSPAFDLDVVVTPSITTAVAGIKTPFTVTMTVTNPGPNATPENVLVPEPVLTGPVDWGETEPVCSPGPCSFDEGLLDFGVLAAHASASVTVSFEFTVQNPDTHGATQVGDKATFEFMACTLMPEVPTSASRWASARSLALDEDGCATGGAEVTAVAPAATAAPTAQATPTAHATATAHPTATPNATATPHITAPPTSSSGTGGESGPALSLFALLVLTAGGIFATSRIAARRR